VLLLDSCEFYFFR